MTTWAAFMALLTTVPSGQRAAPADSRADVVVLSAVVVDQAGRSVAGLRAEDFEVRDNGRAIPISSIEPVGFGGPPSAGLDGRVVVLLLDDLGIAPEAVWRTKDIASGFAARMRSHDLVTVVRLNDGTYSTTSDAGAVRSLIDDFRLIGEPMRGPVGHLSALAVDTIAGVAGRLADESPRRKAIVCIGSPGVFNPIEVQGVTREYGPRWRELIRSTARANASVYVIDPAGLGEVNPKIFDGSRLLAEETGGEAFVNTNEFDQAVDQVWRDSGSYYLLRYKAPDEAQDLRRVDVRVSRPGVNVRARRSRG